MKKINNKGYMLVEIILASVIAFGIAYFIVNMTIKLKNKNDDTFVETLVTTDKAIITNKLMEYAIKEVETFSCDVTKDGNTIYYGENKIDIVNEYTTIGDIICKNELGKISITIPLTVKQMSDKDFDINIDYKYRIGDMANPTCTLQANDSSVSFKTKEDNVEVTSYGLVKGSTADYNNKNSVTISAGTFTGYVKDEAGNTGSCSIDIKSTSSNTTYTCKKSYDACSEGTLDNGWCYITTNASIKSYNSNNLCTHACSGVCVEEECQYCPANYTYLSNGICIQYLGYPNTCSGSGWTTGSDGCYKYNQSSCSEGTISKTNAAYTCASGYTKINNNYCFK